MSLSRRGGPRGSAPAGPPEDPHTPHTPAAGPNTHSSSPAGPTCRTGLSDFPSWSHDGSLQAAALRIISELLLLPPAGSSGKDLREVLEPQVLV